VLPLFKLKCPAERLLNAASSYYHNFSIPSSEANMAAPALPVIQYNMKDCYIRFQKPHDNTHAAALAAQVGTLDWKQKKDEVTGTINDMFNHKNNNIQLWVDGDGVGMLYAGLYTSKVNAMSPQQGLNGDNIVVSVILPPGVQKLRKISGDTSEIPSAYKQAASTVFGVALKQKLAPLVPTDYAYTTSKVLKDAISAAETAKPPTLANYHIHIHRAHDILDLKMPSDIM
jgi:hypothetical protein